MVVQIKEHSTKEYKSLLQKIGNCFTELNAEYISAQTQSSALKEAWFAYGIVKTLLQNVPLLGFGSLRSKQDLIDSIEIHSKKYLSMFEAQEVGRETALIFQTNLTNLSNHCTHSKQPQSHSLTAQEFDVIRDLATDVLQKCQSLFAEQAYNQETLDRLQASSIVFNDLKLAVKQQFQLLDKLLLVKELWQIQHYAAENVNNLSYDFNLNPRATLAQVSSDDVDQTFEQLTNIFTDTHLALQNLSNERLIDLYDRLENFEPQAIVLNNLLQKLHREAQFRYGFNRLSDSGYELLKRFQSYDAIAHQIEIAEFAISESYLLKKNTFLQEVVNTISKHVDNIKAVGAAKDPCVKSVMTMLKQNLAHAHSSEQSPATTLSLITDKLAAGIDSHIYKRYAELDKFATSSLKTKYENLFHDLKQLLEGDVARSHNFLQQSIVRKVAQDYHFSNLIGSYPKLKTIAAERAAIAKMLLEINFVEMFNENHPNSITSLNLKKNIKDSNPQTIVDYVQSIVHALVTQSSAAQLESLSETIQGDSKVQNILREEIAKHTLARTSIVKMFYSMVTGRKQEFNKLKTINKNMQATSPELEQIKQTPAKARKQMESLVKERSENEGMINKAKVVDTNTETLNS